MQIVSTGSYLPKKIVSNNYFGKPTNPKELALIERYMTGMQERHHANSEETGIYMAFKAASQALERSEYEPSDIDLIIGNITPNEYLLPEDLNLVAAELGCIKSIVLPINTACSSFLTGLKLANSLIKDQEGKVILLVNSTNWVSNIIDKNRDYSMFGDGAGATILDSGGDGFISMEEESDFSVFHTMCMKSPVFTKETEYFIVREDPKIDMLKEQIKKPINTAKKLLSNTEIRPDWFIAHQAGVGMLEYWLEQLGLNNNILKHTFDKNGNMMSANIPVTLDYFITNDMIKRGEKILFFSPAAGAHHISILWQY